MELLQSRTSSLAAQIVRCGEPVRDEMGASTALEHVWKELDERFTTDIRPSQEIVENLKDSPLILASAKELLWSFAS